MDAQLLTDIARLIILVMFGVTVGQVLWIVRTYAKQAKRLLPRHITTVGVAYLLALCEVVWQNAIRVGDPITWYVPVNFLIMGVSLYAMRQMLRHLRHRGHGPDRRRKVDQ